jgi:hypothetical protein
MKTVLNIAAGKFTPLDLEYSENYFIVNVDTMYYDHIEPEFIEMEYNNWNGDHSRNYNVKADIFEFLERTVMTFDRICIYRFLEHVPFDKVLYFIYLLSTVTQSGAEIDIIVPNYEILAKMILEEDPMDPASGNFEAHNILLTTELLNEPSCPHASIWTQQRAHYYFQLERRFTIVGSANRFNFDGRDIYLRFHAQRI